MDLNPGQRRNLYVAITDTVHVVMDKGGRNDETDLFGRPGGYVRLMDSAAASKPCPDCGQRMEKIQYLEARPKSSRFSGFGITLHERPN
jgi:hypothetical protein